jgi:WD40 repeat protein
LEKFAEKLASATPARQRAMLGNVHTLVGSNQLEKLEKYYRLLTNFDFMAAKVQHPDFGVQGLIEDYDLVGGNNEKVRTLKLIQGALRLSAHILVKDAKQLAGQLSARLQSFDVPEIKSLLQQISEAQNGCLISLTPSLSSPNGNLICTLSGHVDSVNAVAITPDGKFVVSGSSDHTVKKWDLNTATEVMTFRGHTSPVNAVAITPDGQKVVSGASDNTVRVWNLETGAEILTFNGHGLPIVAVGITLDGQKVVSASVANINSIKVWDLETGKEELTLKGHGDLVRTIAITREGVISGGNAGTIKIWSLKNGKLLWKDNLCGNSDQPKVKVYAIAATVDDNQIVAVGSDNYLTAWNAKDASDNLHQTTIKRLFNLNFWTGIKINQQIYQRKFFRREFDRQLKSHTAPIVDIALTSDGTQFILASLDKTLKVWETKSGKAILTFTGHNNSIHSVSTSPDDKKLISASKDKTLKVWNLDSVKKCIQANNDISVNDVTISPDGKKVFFCLNNNIVRYYDLENFQPINIFTTHKNSYILQKIENIFTSTTFNEFYLILFSYITASIIGVLGFFLFLIIIYLVFLSIVFIYLYFEYIGLIFLIFTLFSISILIRYFLKKANTNIENLTRYTKYSDIKYPILTQLNPFKKEQKKIITIAATVCNQELIFINNMNVVWNSYLVTVWSLEEKKHIVDLLTPLQFLFIVVSRILFILIPTIISASFFLLLLLPKSFLFLIFLIGICAMYVQIIIVQLFNEFPTTMSINSDEKYLIAGSSKGTINIWNMEKKKLLFVLKGHQKKVTTLAITPDDKYLISGSDDQTIKIWNLETRKELFTLKGHGDSVNTISITSDGKHLISGSKDKTIKIWHLENREEIFTFTGHTDSINSVKVTSDGQLVISASSDKTIQVWEFKTRKVIAKFTGESGINCCAVAPDNVTIVAGEEAGNIHFLRLQDFQVTV